MSSGMVVALVIGIIAVVGGVQAAIWIPVVRRLHRLPAKLDEELMGERIIHAPARASYHGATNTSDYTIVGGIGVMALTDRRLAMRKAVGKPFDVPVDQITGYHEARGWRGRNYANRTFLVLELRGGGKLSFIVADHPAWKAAFDQLITSRAS